MNLRTLEPNYFTAGADLAGSRRLSNAPESVDRICEAWKLMTESAEVQTRFEVSSRVKGRYCVNAWLTALVLTASFLQFVVAPLFLLPKAPVYACLSVFLLSLITPIGRALLHEAIHGRLVKSRNWNDRLGRALAIVSGIAFDAIRFGHLTHHRFPRHALDRADVIAPGANRSIAVVKYYGGLLGGIYLREIMWAAILLLPRKAIEFLTDRALKNDQAISVLQGAIRRNLDRRLARTRTDLLLMTSIYTGSFYFHGEWWPILLVGVATRAFIISLQDNVAHYGTPAQIGAAAYNSYAPRWVGLFILNQNLHGVHHDRPEVPWDQLPYAFEASGKRYAGNYFPLLIRQFDGPR
jgi:fatty acid desaturase